MSEVITIFRTAVTGTRSQHSPPTGGEAAVGSELRLVRGLNYFWLAAVLFMLVTSVATTGVDQPGLWHSWRGPSIVVLAVAFLCWYLCLFAGSLQWRWRRPSPCRSSQPRRVSSLWLLLGFAIALPLIALDRTFVGLSYALIGVSLFRPLPAALLPTGVAVALCAWGSGAVPLTHGQSWRDGLSTLFGIAMSVGLVYVLAALIRERLRREHLFAELSEAHHRLRLASAQEADMATLRERNRLAREMHDSLGHALVSISIKLEAVRFLYPVDPLRATAELAETTSLVRGTMTELRHSLAGLRTSALETQTLAGALGDLLRDAGRCAGMSASCTVDDRAALLKCDIQDAFYRVGQEALTNVVKHARARSVTLSLLVTDDLAQLEVCDDGVGIAANGVNGSSHYGVQGMRERVEALGGTLLLAPRRDGGTVLRAVIPAVQYQ